MPNACACDCCFWGDLNPDESVWCHTDRQVYDSDHCCPHYKERLVRDFGPTPEQMIEIRERWPK